MAQQSPIEAVGDSTVINGVAFVDSLQSKAITVRQGRISNISDVPGTPEFVALPPMYDEHVHANRAFTLGKTRPDNFEHAVTLTLEQLGTLTADRYASYASTLFARALHHGTTRLRTHADVDPDSQLQAIAGTRRAQQDMLGQIDVEIVACASTRADPAEADTQALLREAAAMGCSYLGAIPVFYNDPRRSIDKLIELAADLDLKIDVHVDEHLRIKDSWSEYLADATIANNMHGRVCLSHGCVLSALEAAEQTRVIDKLVASQIKVIALPLTNLYLQDRRGGTPRYRGVTAVHELLAAGVPLRFGSDNVCDVFYPFGDGDLLETAFVASLCTQIDNPVTLVQSICGGRHDFQTGDPADLVLVEGTSFHDILRRRPERRIVMRGGVT